MMRAAAARVELKPITNTGTTKTHNAMTIVARVGCLSLSCQARVGIIHMLRHSTGHVLASKGMDTRRLQHYMGIPRSRTPYATPPCRRSRSRTSGDSAGFSARADVERPRIVCNLFDFRKRAANVRFRG